MPDVLLATPVRRFDLVGLVRQAGRFVVVGGASTVASLLLYVLLRVAITPVLANLLAIVVTTVAGSEVHRRITFAAVTVSHERMLVQNVLSWAWASGSTTIGLLVLDGFVEVPTVIEESAALLAMTFLGGCARFALLRWWVFVPRSR